MLIFRMFPQRAWNGRLTAALACALEEQAPLGIAIEWQMTIRLDERNRPEPDLLATTAPYVPDCTFFTPDTVLLVVEVVSPESAYRDRAVKPRKYAEAGIAHYWRVEDEAWSPVVHSYELDEPARRYELTGVHRGTLRTARPFAMAIDLDGLLPTRR